MKSKRKRKANPINPEVIIDETVYAVAYQIGKHLWDNFLTRIQLDIEQVENEFKPRIRIKYVRK